MTSSASASSSHSSLRRASTANKASTTLSNQSSSQDYPRPINNLPGTPSSHPNECEYEYGPPVVWDEESLERLFSRGGPVDGDDGDEGAWTTVARRERKRGRRRGTVSTGLDGKIAGAKGVEEEEEEEKEEEVKVGGVGGVPQAQPLRVGGRFPPPPPSDRHVYTNAPPPPNCRGVGFGRAMPSRVSGAPAAVYEGAGIGKTMNVQQRPPKADDIPALPTLTPPPPPPADVALQRVVGGMCTQRGRGRGRMCIRNRVSLLEEFPALPKPVVTRTLSPAGILTPGRPKPVIRATPSTTTSAATAKTLSIQHPSKAPIEDSPPLSAPPHTSTSLISRSNTTPHPPRACRPVVKVITLKPGTNHSSSSSSTTTVSSAAPPHPPHLTPSPTPTVPTPTPSTTDTPFLPRRTMKPPPLPPKPFGRKAYTKSAAWSYPNPRAAQHRHDAIRASSRSSKRAPDGVGMRRWLVRNNCHFCGSVWDDCGEGEGVARGCCGHWMEYGGCGKCWQERFEVAVWCRTCGKRTMGRRRRRREGVRGWLCSPAFDDDDEDDGCNDGNEDGYGNGVGVLVKRGRCSSERLNRRGRWWPLDSHECAWCGATVGSDRCIYIWVRSEDEDGKGLGDETSGVESGGVCGDEEEGDDGREELVFDDYVVW